MMATVKMREPRAPKIETPTEQIVKAAQQPGEVVDADGRIIGIRRLGPLDRLRLFEALGGDLVANQAYFGYAMAAASVTSLGGVPCAPLMTKRLIEARISEMGEAGLEAVTAYFVRANAPDAEQE
jgi:hypothetical protein